jgi:hypothetical protein
VLSIELLSVELLRFWVCEPARRFVVILLVFPFSRSWMCVSTDIRRAHLGKSGRPVEIRLD